MQTELSSVSLGFEPSNTVTSQWKLEDIARSNWSTVVYNGSATAPGYGNMDMTGKENPRAHYGQFSPSTAVFLAVLMTLLVFATVLGNALVILAFTVDKSLRTRGNFFFLNLAIADFLVGKCLPMNAQTVILNTRSWYF